MAVVQILPVPASPEHPASPLPKRLRAYRLSLPVLPETLVLVVDGDSNPVGWTTQSEPLDSAPALVNLFRKLGRLTDGSVSVLDIECLPTGKAAPAPSSRQIASSAGGGLLGPRRRIRVLEGGQQ